MVRRIRIGSDSPLVEVIRKSGYRVEPVRAFDGREDHSTVVAEFPFSYPKDTRLAKDMSALDQLEVVRRLQEEWSDNAVSCTVYYRKEELSDIREYLSKYYNKNFKSLSFLLHSEHGFQQAPLEEITEEEYNKLVKRTTPITSIASAEFEDESDCATGVCPIK
jgi:ribonucleoside-triphosphate reductase